MKYKYLSSSCSYFLLKGIKLPFLNSLHSMSWRRPSMQISLSTLRASCCISAQFVLLELLLLFPPPMLVFKLFELH